MHAVPCPRLLYSVVVLARQRRESGAHPLPSNTAHKPPLCHPASPRSASAPRWSASAATRACSPFTAAATPRPSRGRSLGTHHCSPSRRCAFTFPGPIVERHGAVPQRLMHPRLFLFLSRPSGAHVLQRRHQRRGLCLCAADARRRCVVEWGGLRLACAGSAELVGNVDGVSLPTSSAQPPASPPPLRVAAPFRRTSAPSCASTASSTTAAAATTRATRSPRGASSTTRSSS